MKQIFILLLLLLLTGGCEKTLDSGGVGFELSDELPVPTALKIYHLADGIELAWQISDSNVVDYFNIYYQDPQDGWKYIAKKTSALKKQQKDELWGNFLHLHRLIFNTPRKST